MPTPQNILMWLGATEIKSNFSAIHFPQTQKYPKKKKQKKNVRPQDKPVDKLELPKCCFQISCKQDRNSLISKNFQVFKHLSCRGSMSSPQFVLNFQSRHIITVTLLHSTLSCLRNEWYGSGTQLCFVPKWDFQAMYSAYSTAF